jgi:hypothetical protein
VVGEFQVRTIEAYSGGPYTIAISGITLLILMASSTPICAAVYVPAGRVVMTQLWTVPVS